MFDRGDADKYNTTHPNSPYYEEPEYFVCFSCGGEYESEYIHNLDEGYFCEECQEHREY